MYPKKHSRRRAACADEGGRSVRIAGLTTVSSDGERGCGGGGGSVGTKS